MKEKHKRLYEELSRYKVFIDRGERDIFSVIYNLIENTLLKIGKGKEPDTEQLKLIKSFLNENRDSEGIADELTDAVDDYMRGSKKRH
ncbi:MAG: hypothetical protein NUV42_01225 [Candidatus Yonathbacteria bacterium]|nr:hypothetical protein [Candidatus Yonathbacteria bacterium]